MQSVLRLDDEGVFRFAPLQALAAGRLAAEAPDVAERTTAAVTAAGLDLATLDSIIVVDDAGAHVRSDAFFRVMRTLGWPYRALGVFQVLPKGLRDGVYDWVARNRYRLFGTHDSCWMPQPAWRDRFLGE